MPTYTTTYSLGKPVVGADEDAWGDTLNASLDSIDDILDGTTPVTGIDINSGTLDGVTIGGTTAGAGTFTTLIANTSITGTLATAAQPNITSVGTLTGLTVSASASLAGASTTADITFGDSDKAIFGAGSDLSIYHDETTNHSYIIENGTGDLRVLASTFNVRNVANTENMLVATPNGSVDLYYDNALKLATTSTGVDITGTLTSDGLTVAPDANRALSLTTDGTYSLILENTATNSGADLTFKSKDDIIIKCNDLNTFRASAGGDISFYEDTGTTAKFFWDASAETLNIGSSGNVNPKSFDGALSVNGTTNSGIYLYDANAGRYGYLKYDGLNFFVTAQDSAGTLNLQTADTTRLHIDSSGNVGIGTTSPRTELNIAANNSGQGPTLTLENTDTSITTNDIIGQIDFYANDGSTGGTGQKATIQAIALNSSGTSTGLAFGTSPFPDTTATERMRIDSSGNLLVGTTTVTLSDATSGSGIALQADGQLEIANSGVTARFNRHTSDGSIAEFRKDGTTVGSIGSRAGVVSTIVLDPRGSGAGLTADTRKILPSTETGATNDGLVDLGRSTGRFKDLYLSGGVYLGGTGAANKLDDYEEGTFTPSAEFTSANPTAGASTGHGRYVKTGGVVTVWFNIANINVTGASGELRLTGLPFSMLGDTTLAFVSNAVRGRIVTFSDTLMAGVADGESQLRFEHLISDANTGPISASDCTDGSTDFSGFVTYPVS